MSALKDWLCNRCDVGVLDPKKRVRASNGLEFVVVCPECGSENPEFSFTNDDDCGLRHEKYSLVAGDILNSEVPIPFASCGCPCCERALLALTFRTPS